MNARLRLLLLALAALATQAVSARAQAASATLLKTVVPIDGNGNGSFEIDETVQYTLAFTNTGLVDLTGVVVRDPSSACIAIDGGSVVIEPASGGTSTGGADVQVDLQSPLPPGETVTITFVATATDIGSCCNQATWTSVELPGGVSDRDLSDGTPDEPTCHVAAQLPGPDTDAIVDKQVLSAGCLSPGLVVEFRVRTQNTGRRPLRDAYFEDILDARFTGVVVDGGLIYDAPARRIYTDPVTYGVGEERIFTYRATLPCTLSGSLSNTARFLFSDQDGTTYLRSDTETVAWGRPDLTSSTKRWSDDPADGDAFVSPGEDVTFTITVRNTGACEALDVTVTDSLDARLVETSPPLVISDGGAYSSPIQSIEWTAATTPALAALQPGSEVTLTFVTQVEPGTANGLIPNTASIRVLGNDVSACPALPALTMDAALQNGAVVVGNIVPPVILLRNDAVSCLADASASLRGILRPRPVPQECSTPSAIDPNHPESDTVLDPSMPWTFAGDALLRGPRCPQIGFGGGRVLIFYELADDCTTTLRVTRDPAFRANVLVSW